MDPCRLLALQQLPTGSQWAWEVTRPSEAELRACGFPGSEWALPVDPRGARNLLLLLHGLGDKPAAFAALGRKMALPETTALALRASLSLPAGLPGHAWHESFAADGSLLATPAAARSLERDCRRRLLALLQLLSRHGWPPHRVFCLGFAQGGAAALDLAAHAPSRLGGVVSVCGHLLGEVREQRLQHYVSEAAALCVRCCNPMCPIRCCSPRCCRLQARAPSPAAACIQVLPAAREATNATPVLVLAGRTSSCNPMCRRLQPYALAAAAT